MKKILLVMLASCIFMGILSGCTTEDTVEPVAETQVIATTVEVLTVETSDIYNTTKLSGTISSDSEVSVFSLMTAEVQRLNVKVGDRVKKGQLLFSVEEYSTTDMVREINNLQNTYDTTKEILEEGLAQIEKALNDTRILYEAGIASKYEVEQLEFSLLQQQTTNKTQLDSLTNSLEQLNSQLKDLNENARIYAPISGVVTQVNIIENMLATSSQPAIVIADDSQKKIYISVAETVIPYVKVGNKVSVVVPSESAEEFEATVGNISPTTNMQTGMYTITIDLPTDREYYLGMFAEVMVTTDQVIDTINIPSNAIIIGDDYVYVYVADSDNVAHKTVVTTGITNGSYTEITSGLVGGEQLVIVGQEYLSDNSLVSISGGGK